MNTGLTDQDVRRRMAVGAEEWPAVNIEIGSMEDYARLAHLHYRAGTPRAPMRVLTAKWQGQVLGVLVAAMPVLNGPWRQRAWPGRFATGDKRADAARVNAELRVISRVVIDPRVRGLGLGVRLVRAYLDEPLTPCTEAIAAMGAICPFFRRAGMAEQVLGASVRDQVLAAVLRRHGIEPYRLACARELAPFVSRRGEIVRALRLWARASRATSGRAWEAPGSILELAGRSVPVRRVAYTAGS